MKFIVLLRIKITKKFLTSFLVKLLRISLKLSSSFYCLQVLSYEWWHFLIVMAVILSANDPPSKFLSFDKFFSSFSAKTSNPNGPKAPSKITETDWLVTAEQSAWEPTFCPGQLSVNSQRVSPQSVVKLSRLSGLTETRAQPFQNGKIMHFSTWQDFLESAY